MALASRVARQLVEPINAIDLNDPAGSETYEELTPLLSKLRSQQRQIQRQMRDLKRRQEEFTAITENMSEGFLVIDQETRVLTYNSAVLRLLYAQVPTEEGESVYALNREAGFRRLEIGTGDSGTGQIALYLRCGFVRCGIDEDYFRKYYPAPIFENGVECRHMIRMSMEL